MARCISSGHNSFSKETQVLCLIPTNYPLCGSGKHVAYAADYRCTMSHLPSPAICCKHAITPDHVVNTACENEINHGPAWAAWAGVRRPRVLVCTPPPYAFPPTSRYWSQPINNPRKNPNLPSRGRAPSLPAGTLAERWRQAGGARPLSVPASTFIKR